MAKDLLYLILALTSRCNLSCVYCHQKASSAGLDMGEETIAKALSYADTGKPLLIQLTGGEPALVPDRIKTVASLSQTMQMRPRIALQTNATLLTDATVELFNKYRIEVGVSLDGPPDIQQELRGHSNACLKGLALLEKRGVPFRVTTVVTGTSIQHLDKLVLLLAGFSQCLGMALDLLVTKGRGRKGATVPDQRTMQEGISRMLATLAMVNRRRKNKIHLREMDIVKNSSASANFCHAASGRSLAVDPQGRLFPCSQTIGDETFLLGTIDKVVQRIEGPPMGNFKLSSEQCENCTLAGRCPGDCPSRLYYNQKEFEGLPPICILYRCLDRQG